MSNSIKLTLGYEGTDFTRNYTISGVADSIAADTDKIVADIKAVNASLSGGTSGGLDEALRSEDYDASDSQNVVGKFNAIKAAVVYETEITPLTLQGGVANG